MSMTTLVMHVSASPLTGCPGFIMEEVSRRDLSVRQQDGQRTANQTVLIFPSYIIQYTSLPSTSYASHLLLVLFELFSILMSNGLV